MGESTTFPFIIFSMHGHKASTQMSFCPKTPKLRLPKFSKLGFSRLWKPITFYVGFWLKWGLKQSCIPCQKFFNDMCHATCKQVNQGNSWLLIVATLLWPSVGVKPNTWKSWDLESSGTPECLELNSRTQNTSHWGVLGVIGKILKRRYRKCPRIGHLDICRPSYRQKKGRELNCQFDSRPLKVGNRPLPKSELGVRCVVGKISTRATSLV